MLLTTLLMLFQAVTPHVNPNATPVPDTVLVDTPSWMYSPVFIIVCIVIIGFGVFAIYKQTQRKVGVGYWNK